MANSIISQSRLKEVLSYDPTTGVFIRIQNCNRQYVGDVAGAIRPRDKYIQIRIDNRMYQAHRLAWLYVYGAHPEGMIDHINGAVQDNRISNLRVVTHLQNVQNRHNLCSRNSSGFLGVSLFKPTGRWRARLCIGKKTINLGYFDTPEKASEAYDAAKKEYCTHGYVGPKGIRHS